jgi:parallel beta-helix repeat protein
MDTKAAVLILAGGAVALGTGPAAAHDRAPLSCGERLTHSVRLRADLTGCTGEGLVIGADGVTVDLNGHSLAGTGGGESTGVTNFGGYSHMTLKNGIVERFGGVLTVTGDPQARSTEVVVRNVSATDGVARVRVFAAGTSRLRLENNAFGGGIQVFDSDHAILDENVVHGGQLAFYGTADGNRVSDNAIDGSDESGILFYGGFGASRNGRITGNTIDGAAHQGIHLAGDVTGTVVRHNTVAHVQAGGITVDSADDDFGQPLVPTGNLISGNLITASFDGLEVVEADHNRITHNTVIGAGTFGDPNGEFGSGGLGIGIASGTGNEVRHNAFTGGRRGLPAIQVGGNQPGPRRPTTNTVIARNAITGNEGDGILVTALADNTELRRNIANHNGADGIHVLSARTTITRNTADDNAGFGIRAVTGVIDGGHNRASGNGLGKCTGVICR